VKTGAHASRGALLILIGPLVWTMHFFAVYLAEAILCSLNDPYYATIVRALGLLLSLIATSLLIWVRVRWPRDIWPSVSRPLIDLSIVAIVLSSIPLLVLRACQSAGA
jgi:hypothetical protein